MFGVFYFADAYFADATGAPTPPVGVGSDNASTGFDLPELGGNSPGSILLGQPGGLT